MAGSRGRAAVFALTLLAVLFAGYGLAHVVQRTSNATSRTASVATTARRQSTATAMQVPKIKKTADRADKTARGTVRYLQGKQGSPGRPGIDGRPGAQGLRGSRGPQGRRGPPGMSLGIEDAIKALNQFCAPDKCRGPQGDKGERGLAGSTGADGPAGAPGAAGPAIAGFSFTDATGVPHTCTDPDGDLVYACT